MTAVHIAQCKTSDERVKVWSKERCHPKITI